MKTIFTTEVFIFMWMQFIVVIIKIYQFIVKLINSSEKSDDKK